MPCGQLKRAARCRPRSAWLIGNALLAWDIPYTFVLKAEGMTLGLTCVGLTTARSADSSERGQDDPTLQHCNSRHSKLQRTSLGLMICWCADLLNNIFPALFLRAQLSIPQLDPRAPFPSYTGTVRVEYGKMLLNDATWYMDI